MILQHGTRLGPYEVIALLGAGGMGEVYRARDTKLNRDVAVKVLPDSLAFDADRLTRFKREAQLLASLNHSNIAQIYGFEDASGVHALVMELVEGPTLADRLSLGPMPLEEVLPIARQIAEALEAAHDQGIIHRDLKPANIKVREDGMVKVLDFGLAKALDPTVTSTMNASMSPTLSVHATMAGVILGTAAYMSPEQAKGKPVDRRADIWAFGVVLHQMLSGKPLYSGETVAETLASVIKDTPSFEDLRPEIPQTIRSLLRRCLERDVRQRLQHIGEARIVLERPDIADAAVARPAAPGKTRDRLAWAAAGLGIVLAAIGWGAFAFFRPATEVPRAVQFLVAPPDGFSWAQLTSQTGAAPSSVAVSPDGNQLALITAASGGKTQLWIRSLDTLLARPLPGTEGAVRPFWSPDSQFVGFFADGKLRKVPASGGLPVTLCDAPDDRGGSWNQNGVILLAPRNGEALQRVSSAGGVATAATKLGSGEIAHRRPYFLPDGQHFLYFAFGGSAPGIHVGSLDATEQKLLLPPISQNVAYARGHLLFMRETTLMAQPFDLRRLELTGEAFPIAEQIVTTNTPANGVFSASENGVLAYAAGQTTVGTELVWFDRAGKEIEVLSTPAAYSYLELSPDGKRASVAIPEGTGIARDIWIFDVTRHVRTRFTSDAGTDQSAIWSPDGRQIVFNSVRKGLSVLNLYQKASDGSGMDEVLLEDSVNKFPSSWSPDGRSLLYRATEPGFGRTSGDLFVLPLSGERKPVPFQQTPANEAFGRFSPDGRWVAFVSAESGRDEIYVAPFPGPGGKRLVSTGGGGYPLWRTDGTELFYLAPDSQLMAAAVDSRGNTFEVASVKPLFETRSASLGYYPYAVTGDGQRFLINTQTGPAGSDPITVVLNWTAGLKK